MKRFHFLALLAALGGSVQAAIEHRAIGLFGPQTGYRGYDVWIKAEQSWADLFPIGSIDTATDILTVPGHPFVNGDSIRLVNDGGSLPSIISPFRNYFVCNVNGNQFKLIPNSTVCGGVSVDFTDAGTGTTKIGKFITSAANPAVFLKNVVLPAGVTIARVNCNAYECPEAPAGRYQSLQGATHFYLQLSIGPTASLTPSTISVTYETTGYSDRTITMPFTPQALTPVTLAKPSSYPAVPNKAAWESQMTARAAQWCDKTTGTILGVPLSYGIETQVWFYDGAWVYNQVADYTGDLQWNNCAQTLVSWYRDLTGSFGGAHLSFKAFSDGLKRQCTACDGRYRSLIKLMAENMAFYLTAGDVRDDTMRETSYVLETNMNAAKAYGFRTFGDIPTGGPWSVRRDAVARGSNHLLGMLSTVRGNSFVYQQTFMIGLAMRALIRYYEFSGDPRVPVEVKATLDYIWTQAWNRTDLFPSYANKMLYLNADAISGSLQGPRCDFNCRNTNQPNSAETTLINLTVPAFAWYWSITGDSVYQTRGDAIFSRALDSPINFSGKIFSENYRWSIDYVSWREGRSPNLP